MISTVKMSLTHVVVGNMTVATPDGNARDKVTAPVWDQVRQGTRVPAVAAARSELWFILSEGML